MKGIHKSTTQEKNSFVHPSCDTEDECVRYLQPKRLMNEVVILTVERCSDEGSVA